MRELSMDDGRQNFGGAMVERRAFPTPSGIILDAAISRARTENARAEGRLIRAALVGAGITSPTNEQIENAMHAARLEKEAIDEERGRR